VQRGADRSGPAQQVRQLFTKLTIGRGWPPGTYEDWLADILAATLLDTP
jgi:hypothetical protein